MSIYLPIAEIPVDIFALLSIGLAGGLLAGMFGIGGGFLITPVLIFIGVPPSVAVATSANQIVASSVTGFVYHWHRRNVDIKMGLFLLIGGFTGAYLGILIFSFLKSLGQIDLAISLIYVIFLGSIGGLMFYESLHSVFRKIAPEEERPKRFSIIEFLRLNRLKRFLKKVHLPYVVHFPKSNLDISIILPISIGLIAGIMVSLMGIGGGFVMIPAMIYLLKMPAHVVVGTSLFQIIFTTSVVTVMHAVSTNSVDVVLASLLIIGGVLGAQMGTRIGMKIPAEKLRLFLAIIILVVCIRLGAGLFIEPEFLYSINPIDG